MTPLVKAKLMGHNQGSIRTPKNAKQTRKNAVSAGRVKISEWKDVKKERTVRIKYMKKFS